MTFRSNREYREYMTKNASQIMYDNWKTACDVRKPGLLERRKTEHPYTRNAPIFFNGIDDHSSPFENNETKEKFLREMIK